MAYADIISLCFKRFVQIEGEKAETPNTVRLHGKGNHLIDSRRKHKALVVIGVLANQVHTTGGAKHLRLRTEKCYEFISNFLIH